MLIVILFENLGEKHFHLSIITLEPKKRVIIKLNGMGYQRNRP